MEDLMKILKIALILLILAVLPVAAGGRQDTAARPADSAAIVTRPGQLPIVTQLLTLSIGMRQSPQVQDYDTNFATLYLERRSGIKTEFKMFSSSGTDSNTQFELMVTSNEKLPDIMYFAPGNWMNFGDSGVFIDLTPYYDNWAFFHNQRLNDEKIDDATRNLIKMRSTAPSGKRYGWAEIRPNEVNTYYGMNFINYKWLDQLGLKMPTTTEEFYNVMTAFRDRNPNGQGNVIPWLANTTMWSAQPLHFLINAFVYYPFDAMTNEANLNVTNGKLWTPWTTEEFRDALRYINRLHNAGIFTAAMFTITQQEMQAIISYQPGEVNRVGMFSSGPTLTLMPETPAIYDYTAQVSLTGPKGVNYYPKVQIMTSDPHLFITKDCLYPEAAFRWMDFLHERDASFTLRYGEKDVDWRLIRPEENIKDLVGGVAQYVETNVLWGLPNNKHWNTASGTFWYLGAGTRQAQTGGWIGDRWKLFGNVSINDGKDVDEKVLDIFYTRQEEDAIREIRSSLNAYRQEAMALFITGAMDLDRDWNTYIQTLDRIGLQRYLQTAQTAYTRTIGK